MADDDPRSTSSVAGSRCRNVIAIALVAVCGFANGADATPARDGAHAQARTDQLRHARDVRGALPARARRALSRPSTPAAHVLVARASYGEQPPATGWPTLVTEARKYMGTNPTTRSRLWCARFMNFVLAKAGYAGTGSDAARSFASYGRRISEPKVGAIAVLTRGKRGGHVGIVTGIDANGNPIIISGNHGHRVGEGIYPKSRVIAYVLPVGRGPATHVASASANMPVRNDAGDEGLSSPIAELLAAINNERPHTERGPTTPVEAAERLIERPRAAATAEPVPETRPGRVVQQVAASRPESHVRVATAYRVTVLRTEPAPLPRPRIAPTPLPRQRPAI